MMQIIEKTFDIIDTINHAYPIMAPLVFILVAIFDREKLSVKLDGVAKFLALITLMGFVKICLWNGKMIPINPYGFSMANFLMVFLEDAFYVMIPFYLTNNIGSKKGNILIWVFFSIIFGVAHRYQGILAIFITATYPYFISNNFAKRTSFGTVMACHFLWDCFVTVLPKVNNLLALMDRI
jgi:hypothetical protein